MTAQAKNRILACIVIAMLLIIAIASNWTNKPQTATVYVPSAKPTFVVIQKPAYDKGEFECMRANLYFEAGNQKRKGMEAVALVTNIRTKTKGYPDTVCGVVKAYAVVKGRKQCAFSWYCDGKSDKPRLHNKQEQEAWDLATSVAERAMTGKVKNFLGRATHYHADYVSPEDTGWANAKRFKLLARVGTHIFYDDVLRKAKA